MTERMRQPLLPHFLSDTISVSLLGKGLAVGALVHSGICLVGTHQDPVQGAVVLILTVVAALLNGTFNGLVGMTIHFLRQLHFHGEFRLTLLQVTSPSFQ